MKLSQSVKPMHKEAKSYGNLTLSSADFPKVAELCLGDNQKFEITARITALRNPDRWEVSEHKVNPKDVIASITITGVDFDGKKDMEEMKKK
jgi:hypothetical protein